MQIDDFERWWNKVLGLCNQFNIDTTLLAASSYFKTNNYHKIHTPKKFVVSILQDRINHQIELIKEIDDTYISDTDRLEFIFDTVNEDIAFFKPSGYDGRDDGRWDIYFESLSLTEAEANFRNDIDALIGKLEWE